MANLKTIREYDEQLEKLEKLLEKKESETEKVKDRIQKTRELRFKAIHKEELRKGIAVNIIKVERGFDGWNIETEEGLIWNSPFKKPKLGRHRITRHFHRQLLEARKKMRIV